MPSGLWHFALSVGVCSLSDNNNNNNNNTLPHILAIYLCHVFMPFQEKLGMAARVDMNVLRWFGHVERMDNERLLKKVMNAKVAGRSARGRPRFG